MPLNTKNSSNYKDMISESDLIHSGPPAVYQLRTKTENAGNLTRMIVGEKNPRKPNKTILLVGETGAGKSTLINALFNHTMGVKWEDEVWFQIVKEKFPVLSLEKKTQTEGQIRSQTSNAMVYEIFGFRNETLPYSLTVIDTPGFGDTRGQEYDDIISERLLELFGSEGGVHEVHAVGLVMKATDNRLTDRLMYVLDSMMSLFGNDLEKNIVALITHSNGRKGKAIQILKAANVKCAKNERNEPVYFLFDNCQDEERTEEEEEEEDLQHADKISAHGMRNFTDFLEKTEPQKLQTTAEVLNERISLPACIQNLKDRIKLTELKQTTIKQIQDVLKKHEKEMNKNEKLTVEIDEVYKDKEPIDVYRNTKYSSNYKDMISESDLIHSGPPAVYQLRTKTENTGNLTRMIVGEKNPRKPNKTILLVGETGAGKSTLINAMFNYTMGVKWEDEVWFQIIEEENKNQFKTQTSGVIVYEIFGFEDKILPYSLIIIDTPGYGNTSGFEHDDVISQRLLDLFGPKDGVHEVHAVGLVMKATDNRLSDRLKYSLDAVMSLFGKDLEKNIVTLITHSNGKKPKNSLQALEAVKIKCAKNEKNEPFYFLFDNCQQEERTEEEKKDLQHADKISAHGMTSFTGFLEKTEPQKLEITVKVLNERSSLPSCIQDLLKKIKLTELKQTEIKQIQNALEKHEEEMDGGFTVEIDEVYKDKEPIDGGMWLFFYQGAVCCTVCEETCHYPGCTKAWYPKYCEVMKDNHCTACTNKCPASDHVKEKWRYVTKTKKTQMTMGEIKKKYEKEKKENESLLENLKKEMSQMTAEKSQFLDESYQHVVRLGQIALKADSASTIVHFDFLIEKMKEEGDTDKVQKLEEMKRRVDEGTALLRK
ncbi:uncharacterized protein LOC102790499 [Neolamprologus brichardi]|uniref:uncharacterized protein LOC102790499 n=1 Tax=Neolamprologus brichardi TaxID=32507 RepID=UPI001643F8DA|nr:uncharacterized protein LOC102790499 [Neolamprologus brichardi]